MTFTYALTDIDIFHSESDGSCFSAPTPSSLIDDPENCVARNVGAHGGQDARNAGSSGPSSNENKTCIISFVLILPLTSLSTTTRCWASGNPTGITILAPDLS